MKKSNIWAIVCMALFVGLYFLAKWIDAHGGSGAVVDSECLVTVENGKTVLHSLDVEAAAHRARSGALAEGKLMTLRETERMQIDSVCVTCAKALMEE